MLWNYFFIQVKYEEEAGKTSFRILKSQLENTGEVRIRIENSAGSAEATAQLKVDKPKEVSPRAIENRE